MNMPANVVPGMSHQSWEYECNMPGGIIVGVDGSPESIAALNTAASIARSRRCPLHAVTVVLPDSSASEMEGRALALREFELRVLISALEPPPNWSHEVTVGRAARSLVMIGEQRAAGMIVIGRRSHPIVDRMTGAETTLQVVRNSAVPVMAVGSEIECLRKIVVATDFSDTSLRAAEIACDLINGVGTVYLAHVETGLTTAGQEITEGQRRHPGDVSKWFRTLMEKLPARRGVAIEPVTLTGSAAPAIMDFADRTGADMISAGSHGHNFLERRILGSVSTRLVREARCAVLIAPPSLASILSFRSMTG